MKQTLLWLRQAGVMTLLVSVVVFALVENDRLPFLGVTAENPNSEIYAGAREHVTDGASSPDRDTKICIPLAVRQNIHVSDAAVHLDYGRLPFGPCRGFSRNRGSNWKGLLRQQNWQELCFSTLFWIERDTAPVKLSVGTHDRPTASTAQ